MGFIYGLKCPESNLIRYIGQTKRKLGVRLAQHIARCNEIKDKYTHKEQWIRKLIATNLVDKLEIIAIEEVDNDLLNDREIYWINYYSKISNLTNGTSGGSYSLIMRGEKNPNYGRKLSQEQIQKLKARIGSDNPNYGNHSSPSLEIVEKRRLAMISSDKFQQSRKSEEYKKKISDYQSRTVCLLDDSFNIIAEYKNATIASTELKYTRGNITNAIRFKRQIGKRSKIKHWVCYKDNYDEFAKISKNFSPSD